MKNLKYFPFQRNRYYYGKLLTVDDFELEQRYFNDKRRMINRFLYGSGIVTGMNVVSIDDGTISIEKGLALDYFGREIVIHEAITKKLSMIEGFDAYINSEHDTGYVYLCVEYDEKEKEQVHNIAGQTSSNNSKEFSKYEETYRLFLSTNEPQVDNISVKELYENKTTIYWENGIRINQYIPRFVRGGEVFQLKIEVENMGQQQSIAFSYNAILSYLKYKGESHLKISFNEKLLEKSQRYEILYELEALQVADTEGEMIIEQDSFILSIENKKLKAELKAAMSTKIVQGDMKDAFAQYYYTNEMNTILKNTYEQSIYLAKIALLKTGDLYIIHDLENTPFKQYIWSNHLGFATNEILWKDIENIKNFIQAGKFHQNIANKATEETSSLEGNHISTGVVEFELKSYRKKGQAFFSDEISHGLGLGSVTIILAISKESDKIVYGSSDVFPKIEPMVELAAEVNIEKGTFIIGLKLKEINSAATCKVYWTAIADKNSNENKDNERRIYIKPNVLNIHVNGTYVLEAICHKMQNKNIVWKTPEGGGIIDKNGMYTAPNLPGVYEVIAESEVYDNVKASIFVVVTDKK